MGSLLSTEGAGIVMCDQVSWELFGLSMASWNAVASFAIAGLWVLAFLRRA
jgi:disulfide bond formation protein DsbB